MDRHETWDNQREGLTHQSSAMNSYNINSYQFIHVPCNCYEVHIKVLRDPSMSQPVVKHLPTAGFVCIEICWCEGIFALISIDGAFDQSFQWPLRLSKVCLHLHSKIDVYCELVKNALKNLILKVQLFKNKMWIYPTFKRSNHFWIVSFIHLLLTAYKYKVLPLFSGPCLYTENHGAKKDKCRESSVFTLMEQLMSPSLLWTLRTLSNSWLRATSSVAIWPSSKSTGSDTPPVKSTSASAVFPPSKAS